MAHLNLSARVIETTIAYVGANESGVVTNFTHVMQHEPRGRAGALEETTVDGGRVLSLQWRPRDATKLNDCDLAVRLVSAEGALDGEAMQRVLVDADGLVLLLESEPDAGERNQRALEAVRGAVSRASHKRVPVVVQVNQREGASELPSLETTVAEAWPRVSACVSKGDGVMETLQRAVDGVVESMQSHPTDAPSAPRPIGSPRIEGNPLLGALRQILQASVSEQISALEARLVVRFDADTRASRDDEERFASLDAALQRISASLLQVGEHGEILTDRLTALLAWTARIEAAVLELGNRTAVASTTAPQRDDVARTIQATGDALRERIDAIAEHAGSTTARLDSLASKTLKIDESVASRVGEIRDALKALGEKVDGSGDAVGAQLAAFIEDLQKARRKGWF